MTRRYNGGCACGAVRYETDNAPVFQNLCQCRDCQHRSGAGHGAYLTFADRGSVTVTGDTASWDVAGDSGSVKSHAFCPNCGSPVYLTFAGMPDLIAVHAASLDDPEQFRPQAVTYGMRALTWDSVSAGVPIFERMPTG